MLRTGGAAGLGLWAASNGLPAFAQEAAPELDLPQGAAGKLTVIHRTEYFEAAQNLFRDTVTKFADRQQCRARHLDHQPRIVRRLPGQDVGRGARPAIRPTSPIPATSPYRRCTCWACSKTSTTWSRKPSAKYGNVMRGINAEKIGKIDGKLDGRSPSSPTPPAPSSAATSWRKRASIRQTLDTWEKRREAALAISDPDNEFWGWGVTVNQSGDGWGMASGILNAFGGHFTDATGTKVEFDSPETVAAYRVRPRDLRPQRQVCRHAAAGRRKLGRHLQQRGLSRRQHRLYAQRLLGLCGGQARQQPGVPEHHPAAPAQCQQRRQPRRRCGRRLADDLQGRAQCRTRQEAGARPARSGQLHPDVGGCRRAVHAGLREPVDGRTDRSRSRTTRSSRIRSALPSRSSARPGRPSRPPRSTPSAPRACWNSRWAM